MHRKISNLMRTNQIRCARILVCSFFMFLNQFAFSRPLTNLSEVVSTLNVRIIISDSINVGEPSNHRQDTGNHNIGITNNSDGSVIYVTKGTIVYDTGSHLNAEIIVIKSDPNLPAVVKKENKKPAHISKRKPHIHIKQEKISESYKSSDNSYVFCTSLDTKSTAINSGSNQSKIKSIKSNSTLILNGKTRVNHSVCINYSLFYDGLLFCSDIFARPPPSFI